MNLRQFKDEQGFTLLEGLVALAIVAVLIPLFFSLQSYLDRSFTIANRQSDLQFYSRMAKIKIENEINLADSLEIRSDAPTLSVNQRSIYISAGRMKIKTYNADGDIEADLIPNMPDDITMNVTFEKITEANVGQRLIRFTISCSSSGDTVDLDTSKLIGKNNNLLVINGTTGTVILYEP